jgi:hypothetical protein
MDLQNDAETLSGSRKTSQKMALKQTKRKYLWEYKEQSG